ncbi:unnamed protein product [Sphagnum tenellum]
MSIMLAGVVPELGFMHLVTSSKSYKTVSRVVTQPLRRINEIRWKSKNEFKGPDMHPLIDFSKTIQTSDESSTESSNHDNEGLETIADDDPPWLILQEGKERAKELMDNGQKEGPNQNLNLLLEEQIDNVLFGEFFDFDDFGDWRSCAAEDEDRRKQIFADNNKEKMSVVFQLEADMDSKRQEEASSSELQSMQSQGERQVGRA